MDKFRAAVLRIRAEQFFEEKRASAKVSAVALANLARAGEAADLELLKLAATYCPEAPVAFYEKLGGTFKQANVLFGVGGALAGAHKAKVVDEDPVVGALRGGGGAFVGANLGSHLGAMASSHPAAIPVGAVLGGLAGYKALTGKYKPSKGDAVPTGEAQEAEPTDPGQPNLAALAAAAKQHKASVVHPLRTGDFHATHADGRTQTVPRDTMLQLHPEFSSMHDDILGAGKWAAPA